MSVLWSLAHFIANQAFQLRIFVDLQLFLTYAQSLPIILELFLQNHSTIILKIMPAC